MPRCLIVDDDPAIRSLLLDYLHRFGHEVEAVPDGTGLRKRLAAGGIELLLLDLMLPDQNGLAAPMRHLSQASAALSGALARGTPLQPLDERRGTREVRETAAVFNRMAARLQEHFDTRSLHMAALSHDLRTPLTRLRMRLEKLPGDSLPGAALDIREMDEMIDGTLAVLREQRDDDAARPLDAAALLQAMVDDLAELGHPIPLNAAPAPRARAHPAALRRIVGNLVGNALRHCGTAGRRASRWPQARPAASRSWSTTTARASRRTRSSKPSGPGCACRAARRGRVTGWGWRSRVNSPSATVATSACTTAPKAACAPACCCRPRSGGGGDDAGSTSSSSGGSSSGSSSSSSCSVIPSETAGPYPGDGTNTNSSGMVNVLTLSGIVRSDIRTSVAGASGTAAGVPLTVTLKLVDTGSSCAGLEGCAIYLWHCTRDGNYSLYSSSVLDENYLRGVQVTDGNGEVTFTTIFPGCYSGRWPHMHFEIYPSLASATSGNNDVKTSQLALPAAACAAISLARDNVFSDDGAALQLASVSGDLASGYAATLTVGIAA